MYVPLLLLLLVAVVEMEMGRQADATNGRTAEAGAQCLATQIGNGEEIRRGEGEGGPINRIALAN